MLFLFFFFFKQKTAYEMRISDWSSDVCSSDLHADVRRRDLTVGQQVLDKRFSNVGWRVGTVYDIVPDLAVYAQYSEAADPVSGLLKIGRASCRERVCQYV